MIDAQGRVDAWTGKTDIQAAGHIVGRNFSVQANLMLNDRVGPAMACAFESATGDLAERMMAALDAVQLVQVVLTRAAISCFDSCDRQANRTPCEAIARLICESTIVRSHSRNCVVLLGYNVLNHMNAGDLAVEKKDNEGALREYSAAEKLVPDNAEMIYRHAVALVNMGRVDESLPVVLPSVRNGSKLANADASATKIRLPDDPKIINRIVSVGR